MKLTSNVYALRIPFVVPTGSGVGIERFVYCYVLLGERTWLIDTGVRGSADAVLGLVAEVGRTAESVERILLTHSHIDHIGSAGELVKRTGAKVYAHPAERGWIEDIERQARDRPVAGFFQLVGGAARVDEELCDGQILELAPELHLRVLSVPGHSPGGCAFFLEEQGILFSGDAVPIVGDMPVYDEPLESAHSLARLRSLGNIAILASAWDSPRFGAELERVLEQGADLLEKVHRAVVAQPTPRTEAEKQDFCHAVVAQLGLPPSMANPMVLRTFIGHLAHRGRPSLGCRSEDATTPQRPPGSG